MAEAKELHVEPPAQLKKDIAHPPSSVAHYMEQRRLRHLGARRASAGSGGPSGGAGLGLGDDSGTGDAEMMDDLSDSDSSDDYFFDDEAGEAGDMSLAGDDSGGQLQGYGLPPAYHPVAPGAGAGTDSTDPTISAQAPASVVVPVGTATVGADGIPVHIPAHGQALAPLRTGDTAQGTTYQHHGSDEELVRDARTKFGIVSP